MLVTDLFSVIFILAACLIGAAFIGFILDSIDEIRSARKK